MKYLIILLLLCVLSGCATVKDTDYECLLEVKDSYPDDLKFCSMEEI